MPGAFQSSCVSSPALSARPSFSPPPLVVVLSGCCLVGYVLRHGLLHRPACPGTLYCWDSDLRHGLRSCSTKLDLQASRFSHLDPSAPTCWRAQLARPALCPELFSQGLGFPYPRGSSLYNVDTLVSHPSPLPLSLHSSSLCVNVLSLPPSSSLPPPW